MGNVSIPIPEGHDEAHVRDLIRHGVEALFLDGAEANLREAEAILDNRPVPDEAGLRLSNEDIEVLLDLRNALTPEDVSQEGWTEGDEAQRLLDAQHHEIMQRLARDRTDIDALRDLIELTELQFGTDQEEDD